MSIFGSQAVSEELWVQIILPISDLECELNVKMLEGGVHSGMGGGIIPETFRICRMLLDRIDDPKSGEVVKDFQVPISEKTVKQTKVSIRFSFD